MDNRTMALLPRTIHYSLFGPQRIVSKVDGTRHVSHFSHLTLSISRTKDKSSFGNLPKTTLFSLIKKVMPPQIIQLEHSESSKSLSSKHEGESTSDPSQSHTHARSDGSTSNGSFVREDTRIVNRTKAIVYICLLLASIAISVAAFFFVKKSEESVFEAEVSQGF
jgi:hypothetical protein